MSQPPAKKTKKSEPAPLTFHAEQERVYAARWTHRRAKFHIIKSGTGWGKDYFGKYWLASEIIENKGGDYLVMLPTHGMLTKTTVPLLTKFFRDDLRWANARHVGGDQNVIKGLPYGANIWLASGEAPDRVQSLVAKGAWINEAGQLESSMAWHTVQQRVGGRGRILVTSTPYFDDPDHWLEVAYRRGAVDGNPLYFAHNGATAANPYYSKAEIDRAREELPDWLFAMRYLGIITGKREGQVYPDWEVAFVDTPWFWPAGNPPLDWPRYFAMDWGLNHPTVRLWAAIAPDGTHWVYREYCASATTREHIEAIREIEAAAGEYVIGGWGDPENAQSIVDWADAGMPMGKAIKHVATGIEKVTAGFKSGKLKIVKGRCPRLTAELPRYHYKKRPGTDQYTSQVHKDFDDACDTLRMLEEGILLEYQTGDSKQIEVDIF